MKYLILGAGGMAGHTIALYLTEQGHDVTGFDLWKLPFCSTIEGDARDTETLNRIMRERAYDAVINCIGILNQAAEENKAAAAFLNGYLPHFLADATRDMNTQIIHMSTDCVFSGKRGMYTEDDLPDGDTFYDRSKALGELDDNKNITLRNSIVGADINAKGIGLFNWFMQQSGPIRGYTDVLWTGQTTLQLAKTMERASVERRTGLYNMVPNTPISKYDLLCLFNRYMCNNKIVIEPFDQVHSYKTLKRTRFLFPYEIPDYETMVAEMAEWLNKHKSLYPHYPL